MQVLRFYCSEFYDAQFMVKYEGENERAWKIRHHAYSPSSFHTLDLCSDSFSKPLTLIFCYANPAFQ